MASQGEAVPIAETRSEMKIVLSNAINQAPGLNGRSNGEAGAENLPRGTLEPRENQGMEQLWSHTRKE